MQLHWSIQKVGLYQKREPQLVGECQGLRRILPRSSFLEQLQGWCFREPRNQGLHTSKASDSGAERSEAPQSCEDPAEQENSPFLWTSADWHHRCHQARLWSGEEDLYPGGETGEKSLNWSKQTFLSMCWRLDVDWIVSVRLFVVRHHFDLV